MQLSKLNEWLTLLANVGVLVGIIFLALEMRQNTDMTRAQTRDAMTEKQLDFYSVVLENPEIAEVWTLMRNDPSQIEPFTVEEANYTFFTLFQMRMWENELYQYRQGLFEENEFQSRLDLWRNNMLGSGGRGQKRREIWESQKYSFSEDFRTFIDRIVSERNN
jgi:hypothetical protein